MNTDSNTTDQGGLTIIDLTGIDKTSAEAKLIKKLVVDKLKDVSADGGEWTKPEIESDIIISKKPDDDELHVSPKRTIL